MSSRSYHRWVGRLALIGVVLAGACYLVAAGPTTRDAAVEIGPDVVIMRELQNLYEPVPFDHKSHARMAQMWDGCTTCHHRSPHPTTQPGVIPSGARTQEASEGVPACKSCHAAVGRAEDIRMPNLKGAYHRQCLNCHREWAHANNCVICHKPKGGQLHPGDPTPDDIVGRMHPPIPEPEEVRYKARYTPADGSNILFRHKEHINGYGLKCINCHHDDNCSHCHDPKADTAQYKPVRPGRNWRESHGPCMTCHQEARCRHCHYKNDQQPPPPFEHRVTGQILDADHDKLMCAQCHGNYAFTQRPGCGGAPCHKENPRIAFPKDRPGPQIVPKPSDRTRLQVYGGPTP
jgi:hypothetical protein